MTALIVALCGLIGLVAHSLTLTETNIVMIFLAGVAFVAVRFGWGPAVFAAVAGGLVFDYFSWRHFCLLRAQSRLVHALAVKPIGSAIITSATFGVSLVELHGLDLHEHGISACPEYVSTAAGSPQGLLQS